MSRVEKNNKKRKLPVADGLSFTHTATFSLANITGNHTAAPITTFVERASTDNKCLYREAVEVEPPSPVKRARAGLVQPIPHRTSVYEERDDLAERYQMGFDLDPPPIAADLSVPKPTLPRVVKPSDPALARFRSERDTYLGNMLRRDGCIWPSAEDQCADCGEPTHASGPQIFRCKSCYGDELVCGGCMVTRHSAIPLHRIERWNGLFFEPSDLKTLGLRVQLGHRVGDRCAGATPLHASIVVLHTNGIHEVAVDACDCERQLWAGSPEEQLQRAGWLPATDDRPRMCATFEVLDTFLTLTYQAKTTMYDYYSVLEKLTNNTGIKPPNRYQAFLRTVREYTHLLMLKRAGRGHAQSGVMGTRQGELAVRCPCCPVPGVNLPEGWENAPPGSQFLYMFFLAIDACFRLKRRLISSVLKDPSLASGWAYMVETLTYRDHLLTMTDQKEMSTCSGLAALDHANTKFSRGYAATGVGMGVCARHEFVQPNGVGDLQKGERYANMDWIFACILLHIDPRLRKIISYDIVCQWWKNLRNRLKSLPPRIRLVLVMALLRFVIPKMHIKGHLPECQTTYSLNYVPGSGQTCGEGIERPWAHIGGVGPSTREMGPGSWEDTLNGHWGSWNWQKIVGLGERLRTRWDHAKTEYADQLEAFTDFSAQQAACKDPDAKDPYQMTVKAITEAEILLQLEKDDAERVENGVPSIHLVSPASFVAAGLEVESEQRRVRVEVERKKAGSSVQAIDVLALRRALNRSIQRLRKLQATYTPAAIVALGRRENVPEDEQLEHVPLFLPSALPPAARAVPGVDALVVMEDSLRDAQCSTALERLRRALTAKSRLVTYKNLQSRHQGANTRARAIVERNETKIRLSSEKYQMAWTAKLRMVDGDVKRVGWQQLRKEDIRCMADAEEEIRGAERRRAQAERRNRREDELRLEGQLPPLTADEMERRARGGENVRVMSWIWTSAGGKGSEEDVDEALQIEWCKAWARVRRWDEEVRLVDKEVRRAGVSLEYRARKWEERAKAVPVGEDEWDGWGQASGQWAVERAEGAVAYALKQAALLRDLARRITVSMAEERRGRGKKRRIVHDDEWVNVDGDADVVVEGEEDELEDLRADQVADDDFVLGGGDDKD
ncbi:hypothetical protein B0H14DRAFT_3426880 [Mycena olivaceomarginata]|nr:hypothetical protein B0H14DRAFT_3426880 [Mycena olivaceomarginata]